MIKQKLREWLFPEYEKNRKLMERRAEKLERIDSLNVDKILRMESIVSEFADAVDKGSNQGSVQQAEEIELDDGRVVVLLGNYTNSYFIIPEVDDLKFGGFQNVMTNNYFGKRNRK